MGVSEPGRLEVAGEAAELYRQHADWLKRAICRAGRKELAEDVVQEMFLRIARYSADSAPRHPRALLLKIAGNIILSSLRKANWTTAFDLDLQRAGTGSVTCPDQLETIILRETILALPEKLRDVFLLSRFEGMSYAQIAEARGIAVKTVEWRMTRALALCAAALRD